MTQFHIFGYVYLKYQFVQHFFIYVASKLLFVTSVFFYFALLTDLICVVNKMSMYSLSILVFES